MTLEESYALGSDATWRMRCQTAGLQSAAQVMAEDPATAGHQQRIAYANRVLLNPLGESQSMAFGVAAQPGITGPEATDQDVLFTVSALWNAWSGVS